MKSTQLLKPYYNNLLLWPRYRSYSREKQKELPNSPDSLGKGYAFLAASKMLNTLPKKDLTIYNRGISGNKVHQLADRWDKDALDLKPDWISILIGVNDYWHMLHHGFKGTFENYEQIYTVTRNRFFNKTLIVTILISFIAKDFNFFT